MIHTFPENATGLSTSDNLHRSICTGSGGKGIVSDYISIKKATESPFQKKE